MSSSADDPRIATLRAKGASACALVELAGGAFEMGSELRKDEQPVRRVSVGPFAVALTPVSNLEFGQFLDATGHAPPRFRGDELFSDLTAPAIGVSWFDAVAYCEWLTTILGRACRLPTEAEREFAARGGVEGVRYPWGNEPWDGGVHTFGSAGGDHPHSIGTSPPNGYGLYHMADNVHEWCSDWYDVGTYANSTVEDPRGPAEGTRRASRGGSWRHRVKVSRIAARSSLGPDRQYNDYGMRVYADAREG